MRKLSRKLILAMIPICLFMTGCEKETNNEKTDLYTYIGFVDEATDGTTSRPADDQVALIISGDASVDYRAIDKNGVPYLEIDAVQKFVDRRFYWDSVEGYVMYTNATDVYSSYVEDNQCYKNGTPEELDYVISYVQDGKCYLHLDFVNKFVKAEYEYFARTDSEPARLYLNTFEEAYTVAKATETNYMRTSLDLMSPIVIEVAKDQQVTILEKKSEWNLVQTQGGYIGYVQTKSYGKESQVTVERTNDYDTYSHITKDEKVVLVWHQVMNSDANNTIHSLTEDMKGANVISPTWITMSDTEGGITSIASSSYVDTAHDMGLDVWILADDFSSDSEGIKYVNSVLAATSSRRTLTDNLINEAIACGADGINIDYEYISLENGDNYLQFLREISIKCEEHNLVLSVDNYIPSDWSGYYDFEQQGRLADYVVVMSYDEHTGGSDQAGPVASISYVTKAVEDTVNLVGDSSRVIMGVPFYTRIWEEVPEEYAEPDEKIIQDTTYGNYALRTSAVGMYTAKQRYQNAGATPAWNEETGTNYVYFEEGTSRIMIWIEDAESIQKKLDVANQYNIGGIGCWKLGLESSDIWDVIENY